MFEKFIVPILMAAVGAVTIIRIMIFYKNPESARNYIESSPKALIWKKLFGVDKTVRLTKIIFAPLGLVISSVLIVLGILYFIMQFSG